MSDQTKVVQNHLTTKVAVFTLADTQESKSFVESQADLKSSIGWNMFFLPFGIILLDTVHTLLSQQMPGLTVAITISTFVSMFFLLRLTRNSIDKSIEQIRYNEVNNTTRIIADYVIAVGDTNGISLASTQPDQGGASGLQAVQAPREENEDSVR